MSDTAPEATDTAPVVAAPAAAAAPSRSDIFEIIKQLKPGEYYCRTCQKVMPKDQFREKTRRFYCKEHLQPMKRQQMWGTPEKRAVNSMRAAAWLDMHVFGMTKLSIRFAEILALLKPEHVQDPSHFSIVPIDPTKPLEPGNAAVVRKMHRKCLVECWKQSRSKEDYTRLFETPISV